MRSLSLLPCLTALLCAAVLPTGAGAVDRVPGTQTYYSVSTDAITDVNTSFVTLQETSDTSGQTFFSLRCASYGEPELWASLTSKNTLIPTGDADLGLMPAVTIRLGSDAPIVVSGGDLTSVVTPNDAMKSQSLGLGGASARQIVSGLSAGKRLVIRINRAAGGQALTYTFPAGGFASAWAQVRRCGVLTASQTAPSRSAASQVTLTPPATGGASPKFTRWYFTTCRDASSGAVRTGLRAGRAHLCDLVIETVPNGAQPVSATFSYELEYREGNAVGKLKLDTLDCWPATTGPVTRYRASGSQLIFTLPLNVRARPDRVYTSINVTADILFSNGSRKKVYEPLPVQSED